MGQSTDAYLFYGVLLPEYDEITDALWLVDDGKFEHDEMEECDVDDVMKEFNKRLGRPEIEYIFREDEEGHARCMALLAERKRLTPVGLVSHCSGDHPYWAVIHLHSFKCANRGYPNAFDALPELPDDIDASIAHFCDTLGFSVPEDAKPTWHIASNWN